MRTYLNFTDVCFVLKLNDSDQMSLSYNTMEHIKDIIKSEISETVECRVFSSEHNFSSSTLFISIGGDGTMLFTMKQSSKVGATAIGINQGNVGFLTDFSAENRQSLTAQLILLFTDKSIDRGEDIRYPLKVLDSNSGQHCIAINDISVSLQDSNSIITCNLYIDDQHAGRHRCNSMIVSTPTGSTAFALSAGGPIIHPNSPVMEIVFVAPLNLTSRPIVISNKSLIELEIENRHQPNIINVKADGQKAFVCDTSPVKLKIGSSTTQSKLIHPPEWNFFKVLRTKMKWNE